MKRFYSLILCVFMLLLSGLPMASAGTFETATSLDVKKNILGDVYYVVGRGVLEGDIFGDLYVSGGEVVIEGDVHEDLVILGGRVVVTGDVGGDLRIIGGQVSVYGDVGDDLIMGGYQLDIAKSSVVSGDLISGASILTMDGVVRGNLRGIAGALILNGRVLSDVDVKIQDAITLGEEASVEGDLKYSAILEGNISRSKVLGDIVFNEFDFEGVDLKYEFLSYLSSLILVALFVLFVSKPLIKSAQLARENIFRSFVVGLVVVIVAVVAPLILMLTLIGIPIALIIFGSSMIIFFLAKIFVASIGASYFLNFKKKVSKRKLFIVMSIILFAYYLVGMIPYLGMVVELILFMIGVGAWAVMKWDYIKVLRSKKFL